MSDVEWTDPPEAKGGLLTRREQREFAAALRGRPGDWAVLPARGSWTAVRALASRINRGRQSSFGEGFEAISRNRVIYVRFVGS